MTKFRASDSLEYAVMRKLNSCPGLRNSVPSAVELLLSGNSTKEYLSLDVHSSLQESSVSTFAVSYLVTNLLSKWKGLPTGLNVKREAIRAWIGSERRCKQTNQRIKGDRTTGEYPAGVAGIISDAQRKISDVLGVFEELKTARFRKWSNGATSMTRRVPFAEKMSIPIAVTRRALPYLVRDVACDPLWLSHALGVYVEGPVCPLVDLFVITDEERFLTVPKNAKTDRTIQAAPAGNAFLQQGVGSYIRRRLKHFGIDLDDQSHNQLGAEMAYKMGMATLDLRAASDTISRELVWLLLPPQWATYLDDLRVGFTRVKGQRVRLQKFSAMGNAYTFELETLIFWAIGCAVLERNGRPSSALLVYGDDIIAPRECAPHLIDAYAYFGFETNVSKSFVSGDFFESCGKHFFKGVDVTPVYQKEIVRSLDECIRLHNRLVRWRMRVEQFVDDTTVELLREICSDIRKRGYEFLRNTRKHTRKLDLPKIPEGYTGDDGFLVPIHDVKPLRVDPNKGLKLLVYRFVEASQPDGYQLAAYAYKLRRPFHTYSYARGHMVQGKGSGKWHMREAWFTRSGLAT